MDHRPLRGFALSLVAFTALALAVYACAVNPVTGRSELSLVSFSPEEEVALGAKAYGPAVQQQGGFYRDNALEAYVQGVGMRLAGVSIATGGSTGLMELSGITASLVNNGFSREQEREADWLGIDYMVKAGYNPEGAVQLQEYFYKELEGGRNPMFLEGIFRTHPVSKERLENARGYIAKRYPGTVRNPNYTFNEMIFLQKTAHLREVQKAYDLADEGDKLLKEKRYGEALAKYQAAAAREPAQAPFPSSIGRVHLIRKEYADAEDALRRAVRLDDEFFEPHLLLGALWYQKNEYRQAIPELSRSMDLLPTKQAAGMLSKSYEAVGDRENARKYAEMAK